MPSEARKYLAVCGSNKEVASQLNMRNIETYIVGESRLLSRPVASHADMLCAVTADGSVLSYDDRLNVLLKKRGVTAAKPGKPLSAEYPGDVPLNCLHIGDLLVANTKYCVQELLDRAAKCGRRIIHVNQGYARCSVAVVSKDAAITADGAIAAALEGEGVDVLRITPGGIELPGYNYGFIGGCCASIPEQTDLIFCGNPERHPDGRRIVDFVKAHGCTVFATSDAPLYDFGGVVFISLD